MDLQITDISMESLLRLSKGRTDGHFLVMCFPTGLNFTYVTTEELATLKLAVSEKEATA